MGVRRLLRTIGRFWMIILQLTAVVAANVAAFALRFDGQAPAWAIDSCAQMLPWLLVIRAATFIPFRLFEGLWRYASIYDLRAIVSAVVTSSVLFAAFTLGPM